MREKTMVATDTGREKPAPTVNGGSGDGAKPLSCAATSHAIAKTTAMTTIMALEMLRNLGSQLIKNGFVAELGHDWSKQWAAPYEKLTRGYVGGVDWLVVQRFCRLTRLARRW
ncbi:hypothetical protein TorRG33x02_125050 [Trema orientale]|uniref:Uncharacterized protein n=1 Tax=Trema orientale TaxID=63057 RepID=A0A2P5F1K9_TREOI|nr:hypothetical protein TorRG33x02_125050 [Trema orientale]